MSAFHPVLTQLRHQTASHAAMPHVVQPYQRSRLNRYMPPHLLLLWIGTWRAPGWPTVRRAAPNRRLEILCASGEALASLVRAFNSVQPHSQWEGFETYIFLALRKRTIQVPHLKTASQAQRRPRAWLSPFLRTACGVHFSRAEVSR